MNGDLIGIRLADALHTAATRAASDVHLVAGVPPALRVDGTLVFLAGPPLRADELRAIAGSFLEPTDLAAVEAGTDVSVARIVPDVGLMRVHALRSRDAIALALRLLPRRVPSLESLELPSVIGSFAERLRGLVLFSGPTGSGKSTTLAAVVDRINAAASRRIVTIEDPIEYRHESKRSCVTQREVGRDTRSFADALVGALRADPDVIVVGEMRDAPAMRAALAAAETGHLVLATLHTGDAVQTLERIVDAFSAGESDAVRTQLAHTLVAVVAQRLVLRADGRGRRAVTEILVANDAVRHLIREGRTHQLRNVIATGRSAGMQTLADHAAELLSQQKIDGSVAAAVNA